MDRPPAPGAPGGAPGDHDRRGGEPQSIGDLSAAAQADGARADAARAEATRRRLREQGIIPIDPDATVDGLLDQAERVLAVRYRATLDRRQPVTGDAPGLGGDLYVTTSRVIHVGREPIVVELEAIVDAVVVGERLVLATTDGHALTLQVDDPRALRVEIAAARAAVRGASERRAVGSAPSPVDSPSVRSSSE
jgi:hypothetical protein